MWKAIQPVFSVRFFKFAAVGGSGVLVNLAVLLSLSDGLGLNDNLASGLAILVSVSSNFAVNERWTFADGEQHAAKQVARRWLMFHAVSLLGAVIQWTVFVSGNLLWAALGDGAILSRAAGNHGIFGLLLEPPDVGAFKYVSQLGGIATATLWNFLANFYWTWAARGPYDSDNS